MKTITAYGEEVAMIIDYAPGNLSFGVKHDDKFHVVFAHNDPAIDKRRPICVHDTDATLATSDSYSSTGAIVLADTPEADL